MKKIKKGFTLIELLAVIVILSIILIIAVPAILKNINGSKKSVFNDSANLIIKVIDQIIISDSLDSNNILEQEITDSYRCITSSEATSFGLNPAHYDIGYDNGSDTTCSQVAYRDGKTYVRLVANATGKFAGMQPLSSPGYLPSPIECFTFDIPTAKITGYNLTNPSCSREVSIPEKINGVAVKIIGDSAFEGKQITGVEIPYGVTTIEYEAFWKNLLVEVTIPNSVTTLGDWAFQDNQLDSVVIPNSVTMMGEGAFYENRLTSAIISNNLSIIKKDCFGYNYLKNITIPNSVTTLGDWAFYENQLNSITIPTSVTVLGDGVFEDNRLTSITIPNSLTTIGTYVFAYNQISSVSFPGGITIIPEGIFWMNQFKNVTIPTGVTIIRDSAFADNQINTLTIPSSVTTIEDWAFETNNLTNITIPLSVTNIGMGAFNKNQLSDDQAFIYARNLDGTENKSRLISYGGANRTNVIIPNTVNIIDEWSLSDNQLTSVSIPSSVTTINRYSFAYNEIASIIIPSSVATIGYGAFNNNQLPNNQAFIYARNPDGTENISRIVSYGGANKTNVTIPNTVTTIGQWAFFNSQIISIFIPNSVTAIEASAFRYNYITQGNAKIDNSIGNVTIGSYAFQSNGTNRSTTITPTYLR